MGKSKNDAGINLTDIGCGLWIPEDNLKQGNGSLGSMLQDYFGNTSSKTTFHSGFPSFNFEPSMDVCGKRIPFGSATFPKK